MKTIVSKLLAAASLCGLLFVSGCTQMPTERSGVSDMRPQISFGVESESLLAARVVVDGLDVGAVSDYKANEAALRVLPGNHRIQVYSAGRLLLDEKVYVGDGVNRAFQVR